MPVTGMVSMDSVITSGSTLDRTCWLVVAEIMILLPRNSQVNTTGAAIISRTISPEVIWIFSDLSSVAFNCSNSARRSSISAITQVWVVQVADVLVVYDSSAVVVDVGYLVQTVPLRTQVANVGRNELQGVGVVPW